MFKNYLKIAARNLLKHKAYSLINIAGLTCGLACCLLIFQYVAYEYSFDDFNVNAPNLYRVNQTESRSGRAPETEATNGYALGPALAQDVPEVMRFTRLHADEPVVANPALPDKVYEEERVFYADPAFLQMFSYPLVSGNRAQALAEPGTILLSESAAQKYFGSENPIGQVLSFTGWIKGDFRVNGVFQNVPANSHLQFDFLLPISDLLQKSSYKDPKEAWPWQNFFTYVELRPDANAAEVERKFTEVLMRHRGEQFKRTNTKAHLSAQPLHDVHLNDTVFAKRIFQGSYRTVYFFTLIALMTLIIALVNNVNLATARSLDRSREVGVRKVIGAQRAQLVLQFLFESALTNLIAMLFAIALADMLTPLVNNLAGTRLTNLLWADAQFWIIFLATFAVATLLAGLYPAFVLSSFKPASVLKGKTGSFAAGLWLRRGLVVLQFSVSIVLLAGTTVVYSQLDFMRSMDLGINLEQILNVRGPRVLPEGADRAHVIQRLTHELRQIPAIKEIAKSNTVPGQGFDWHASGLRRLSADPSTGVSGALAWIDTSFARLYGLQLIAGDDVEWATAFSPEGTPMPVIANETVIQAVGFESPGEALNQLVAIGGETCKIVGVFRDFNWSSAHSAPEPVLFTRSHAAKQLSLKVSTANLPETIAAIERIYKSLFPGNPFLYAFVDEQFDEQYKNDQRFATLFSVFAGLAILIACLGLFGLASFAARQRTKEIGIRKVLGATVTSVVNLLSKDFVKLVLLANIFAAPVAYFAMNKWLQNFAYRVEISSSVFILAGGMALLIALATVSAQAVKAALANPVEALRYE